MRRTAACLLASALAIPTSAVALPSAAHADAVRDSQWYLEELDIERAHQMSLGEGITIGLIDSGVDASHPDLEGRVLPGKGYGAADDQGLEDPDGHGTGVASLIAGDDNDDGVTGIAPGAQIMPVGVACEKAQCSDDENPAGWVTDGIDWLAKRDVDLIVVSTSVTHKDTGVDAATDNGIPLIATAGNTGDEAAGQLGPTDTDTAWPARADGAVPVTGTDRNGKPWKESRDLRAASGNARYGVAAPAVDLAAASPGGHYATHSDTSGATAITAGTMALIMSSYPDLDDTQLIERLCRTADRDGTGYDKRLGWGVVNPVNALRDTVEHAGGGRSGADDMLPLEQQVVEDKDSAPAPVADTAAASENPAVSSSPWALVAITVGTVIFSAAITITLITLRRRRHAQVAAANRAADDDAAVDHEEGGTATGQSGHPAPGKEE